MYGRRNCLIHGETDNITFKTQKSKKEASKLCFTEKQASAILEMRLYRLIGLEIMALQEEYAEILKKIDKYQDILEHPASMKKVMKKEERNYFIRSSKTKYQTGLGLSSNFFTKLLPALQKKLAQNSIPGNIQTADGNICKYRRRCGLSQASNTIRCSGYNIVKLPA